MSAFDGTDHPSDRMSEYQRVASEGGLSLRRKTKRLEVLSAVILPDEPVLALTSGTQEGHFRESLIALTDRRILILKNDPRDAVSLDLARVVRVTATQGTGYGQMEIWLQDIKWAINLAHSRSVMLFARRAEVARLERGDPRSTSLAQLDYQDAMPSMQVEPPQVAPATALPAVEQAPKRLSHTRPKVHQIAAGQTPVGQPQPPRPPAVGDVIDPDEQVVFFTTAADVDLAALIALTDRRVLVVARTSSGDTQTMAVDLDQIESISGQAGASFGSVQVDDGRQTWSIPLIQNDMVEPFVNRVREAVEARRPPAPPAASPAPGGPATTNVADELDKLASLLERGILTPEEFAQQKAKLLDS